MAEYDQYLIEPTRTSVSALLIVGDMVHGVLELPVGEPLFKCAAHRAKALLLKPCRLGACVIVAVAKGDGMPLPETASHRMSPVSDAYKYALDKYRKSEYANRQYCADSICKRLNQFVADIQWYCRQEETYEKFRSINRAYSKNCKSVSALVSSARRVTTVRVLYQEFRFLHADRISDKGGDALDEMIQNSREKLIAAMRRRADQVGLIGYMWRVAVPVGGQPYLAVTILLDDFICDDEVEFGKALGRYWNAKIAPNGGWFQIGGAGRNCFNDDGLGKIHCVNSQRWGAAKAFLKAQVECGRYLRYEPKKPMRLFGIGGKLKRLSKTRGFFERSWLDRRADIDYAQLFSQL